MSNDSTRSETEPRLRSVRSFVMRAGRTTRAQSRALQELWPRYGLEFAAQPLDLDAIFERHSPRMIEIGFGAGEALLEFARSHPHFDCIGIEVHPPGMGHFLLSADAAALSNVRVLMHDAVEVLSRSLRPGSINRIHIFFPDPWPKKRHHKRRLIQPAFAHLLTAALATDGEIKLATDWEPYAMHMREVLEAVPQLENCHGANAFAVRADERPLTRFERRGQRLGHEVWDLHYRLRM